MIQESARLRDEGAEKLKTAVFIFEQEIGVHEIDLHTQSDSVSIKNISSGFRRFDSQYQIGQKHLKAITEKQNTVKIDTIKKDIFIGNRGKRNYVDVNGIPFLSSSDMLLANPIRFCKFVSKKTPGIDGLKVHHGYILISRSGTVGNTIMVNKALDGFAVSEHAMRLIIDESKIEPEYVYAYLKTCQGQGALHTLPYGSVIVTLGEEYLADIDLPMINNDKRQEIVSLVKESNDDFDLAIKYENEAISMVEAEIAKWSTN